MIGRKPNLLSNLPSEKEGDSSVDPSDQRNDPIEFKISCQ